MSSVIVIARETDLSEIIGEGEIVTPQDFILGRKGTSGRGRVINLVRDYGYLGYGYYCSLLAEARGQKVIPSVRALMELSSKTLYHPALGDVEQALKHKMARLEDQYPRDFSLRLFFGRTEDPRFRSIGQLCYDKYRVPILDLAIRQTGENWEIRSLKPVDAGKIRPDEIDLFWSAFTEHNRGRWPSLVEKEPLPYSLAVLHNPREAYPPSCPRTLKKLAKIGESMGMAVKLIQKRDFYRLAEFDALFIRETTSVADHTFRFARRAEREGMPVLDSTTSILRCANKVYLAELLSSNRIPAPRTVVVTEANLMEPLERLGLPLVLKIPDGSFSRGVTRAESKEEYLQKATAWLKDSDVIIAQEFMFTEFDWRVGILARRPLFVCQYQMAQNHWQVYNHKVKGAASVGDSVTLPVDQAPKEVLDVALRAANLIGDGLYGVDLKQTRDGIFVIEVNDNPNIDLGYEDAVLKDELYRCLIRDFIRRIEA